MNQPAFWITTISSNYNKVRDNHQPINGMSEKTKLDLLSLTIEDIKDVCSKILKRDVELNKMFKSGECDVILDLYESDTDIAKATELLRNHIQENSSTAERIIDEIDLFSSKLVKGKLGNNDSDNFLYSVWSGDYFGEVKGIKALLALKADMKENLRTLSDGKLKEHLETKMSDN